MKGTVKWFNTQKVYGFIVGDDGTDYFVHYSNIKVSEFRHLDAGDHVEFDVETNDKGIQAINVVPVLAPHPTASSRCILCLAALSLIMLIVTYLYKKELRQSSCGSWIKEGQITYGYNYKQAA